MIGSTIGGMLEPPTEIEGQSLSDLRVTGTDYGSPIPWVAGAPRLPGDVIWASDRRKIGNTESVGKGGGGTEVTTYTYEVDIMYLLADQEGATVTRVWANGRLVWTNLDSAPDQSRIASEQSSWWRRITPYGGDAGQLPDPTYEASVGGVCPAYRGRLTLMIEGMQLGSSGMIPVLTFEVASRHSPSATVQTRALVDVGAHAWKVPALLALVPDIRCGSQSLVSTYPFSDDVVYRFTLTGEPLPDDARTLDENYPTGHGTSAGGLTNFPVGIIDGLPVRVANHFYSIGTPNTSKIKAGIKDAANWEVGIAPDLALALPDASTRFIGDVMPCSDGTSLMIFTGATSAYFGGATLDKWHIVRRNQVTGLGELVREGGISPARTWRVYGGCAVDNYSFTAAMLEDDGEHVWWFWGAGAHSLELARIDPADGVLRTRATVSNAMTAPGFLYPSIWAEAGYCVVVAADQIGIFRRGGETIEDVSVQEVVEQVCHRAGMPAGTYEASALAGVTRPVRALAAAGGTARAVLEQLAGSHVFGAYLDSALHFVPRGGATVAAFADDDLASGFDVAADNALPLTLVADLELPNRVSISYPNMDADQQMGEEHAERWPSRQDSVHQIRCNVGLLPSEARGVAEAAVRDAFAARLTGTVSVPIGYAARVPTDPVTVTDAVDGTVYRMRIIRRTDAGGVLTFDLVGDDAGDLHADVVSDEPGASQAAVDALADTVLAVLDMPLLRDEDDVSPGPYVAARSAGGGVWPGCAVMLSQDGAAYVTAASIAEHAVFGSALEVLGAWAAGWVMDETNTLLVDVGAGTLSSTSRADLLADGTINAMLIGDEVIRYVNAVLTGTEPNRYRLSRLLRGQAGTEWAVNSHVADERAVALTARGLRHLAMQWADLGAVRRVKAVTAGQRASAGAVQEMTLAAVAQVPYAPVDLRLARAPTDDIVVSWKRRTRYATRFCGPDGSYVPLGEGAEAYSVEIIVSGQPVRTAFVSDPTYTYSRSQAQADHGAVPAALRVRVRQISATVGAGRALEVDVPVPASIAGAAGDPGGPLPPPPGPVTYTQHPTNIVAETAAGVLVMREEAGIPVYYLSSGAALVPLGMASTAWMPKGHYHDGLTVVFGGKVWYIGQLDTWGPGDDAYFVSSVLDDYSAAPVATGLTLRLPTPSGWDMAGAIGIKGALAVAINDSQRVSHSTAASFPAFVDQGAIEPDPSEGWTGGSSYLPGVVRGGAKLLPTTAGWLFAASNAYGGLAVYRTTDTNGVTGWRRCSSSISAGAGQFYDGDASATLYDVLTQGNRCYLLGRRNGAAFLAISTDGGASWAKTATGVQLWPYMHLMALAGGVVCAISQDGQWVAINDGVGTAWAEYRTVGLGRVPWRLVTRPRGGFFVDTSHGEDVVVHTSDGITWSPVA